MFRHISPGNGPWSMNFLVLLVLLKVQFAVLLLAGQASAQAATTLRFVSDEVYPPLSFYYGTKPKGLGVDLARAVADQLGRPIDIGLLPWSDAQAQLQQGRADFVGPIAITPQRRELYDFTAPFYQFEYVFLIRADFGSVKAIKDLAGKRVGITAGGYPSQRLKSESELTLVLVDDTEQAINLLRDRKIDAYAVDKWVAIYELGLLGVHDVVVAGPPFETRESALAVKKGNAELLKELDSALASLHRSGFYQKLLERWQRSNVVVLSEQEQQENEQRMKMIGALALFVLLLCGAWILFLRRAVRKATTELRDLNVRLEELVTDLRDSEENLAITLHSIGDAVIATDPTGRITRMNPAAECLCGWPLADAAGRPLAEVFRIVNANTREVVTDPVQKVMAHGKVVGLANHTVLLAKDGKEYPIADSAAPIHNATGDIVGVVLVFIDITERKQAEEEKQLLEQQFQQIQRLESLGVLAGGIAHDFNNILAIIMGCCELTKMDYESAEENIPKIEKAVTRAAALCRQMLAYAGKATLSKSQVNTLVLVNEMIDMLKTTIQQNVVIKHELGTDIPFVMGDASQLRQVVVNLITNAAEAIGYAAGEVQVRLAKRELVTGQPEKDHLGFIIPAGNYICFEVSDNGCGMDDETRGKIFEPFYTTKFTGRGLGMSAVLGIIKAHNGALQLESRLGHGTTFRVYLPVSLSKPETEEAQQITTSAAWHGSGTVLLAEDEVQFKTILTAMLQDLGFKVLDAANGKEALELYQQNAADISLVISDMGMPVMDGYELFYKLKKLDPKLPIIISSGFGEVDIASKIPREVMAGVLNKPYRFDQLQEVLRGVVEGSESGHS